MHSDLFYTALFSHKTSHWTFIQNMAEKSAESCVSLRAMIKQFSILQNVIKVMVVLKKGRWLIKTYR